MLANLEQDLGRMGEITPENVTKLAPETAQGVGQERSGDRQTDGT